jgi:mono/diheme cytochrome c family protein
VILNVLSVLLLVLLGIGFAWLARSAWRLRRAWVRWIGVILAGLLSFVFFGLTVVSVIGLYRLNFSPHKYTISDVQVAMTPGQIERGKRLAYICVDCHSSEGEFPLDGSKGNFIEGGPPVGVLYAPNLTPGGPLKEWSDGEIIRALREGVDESGRPLIIMPSQVFRNLSDEDAQAITAFLRSQPAVERDLPERNLNIIAALFLGTGMFSTAAQEPIVEPVAAPATGSADYGHYLVTSMACQDCHGEKLDGVTSFGPPGAPNLTLVVPNWTEEQFVTFFQSGKLPEGRTVDPQNMPWKLYSQIFSEDDLKDMYSFLKDLPPSSEASVETK